MSNLYNSLPIGAIAKTITDIVGINSPKQAEPSINIIHNCAKKVFEGKKADRVFIYNPDAVALWLFQKYTERFERAILQSDLGLPMLAVMPTVTPVCFASMYSGASPDIHGISAYEKPILKIDTVFDAFIKAGLKPAIISTAGDSISCIFLEREMDYFIYETSDECNKKAMELIEEDKYDLIVLYDPKYDNAMHRNGPESKAALAELANNIDTYSEIIEHIKKHWAKHRTMIGFCPDHGCHEIDGSLGSHGLNMAEDMNVIHFYRFIDKTEGAI
ncbi:MAG: alkaline phosphatase family protein [Defluviitaleaceae bacterium]|nr:alkaline phosphatase family protein [Defluviitaleaceae bacterium]